jgi:excisionase family DNA binding protein
MNKAIQSKNTFIPRKRLYTLKEAGEYLGRPVWSIRKLIWSGKIPVIQDGRKMYLDINDLNSYIDRFKKTEI